MRERTLTLAVVGVVLVLLAPLAVGIYMTVQRGGAIQMYILPVLWTLAIGGVTVAGVKQIGPQIIDQLKVSIILPVASTLALGVVTVAAVVSIGQAGAVIPFPVMFNFIGSLGIIVGFSATSVYIARTKSDRERVFKEATEASDIPVFITDTDGTIEYVNDAFVNQTGYGRDEAIGNDPSLLNSGYHPDEYYTSLWETILSGDVWSNIIVNETKAGDPIIVSQTIAPIMDDSGDITQFVSINHNITDLKRYESKLEERNEALEMLTHMLRHDVKNDVNIIKGLTTQVMAQVDDDSITSQLEDIHEASEHVEEITTSVKTYLDVFDSDTQTETRRIDIVPLVDNVVQSRRAVHDSATIHATYESESMYCVGNNALQSAVRNIINNAVQHNDKDTPEVHVSVVERPDAVVIQIADNGPGMADVEKDTLFSKDSKRDGSDGSGIGLWVTKKIVSAVGGEIHVSDADGGGALFEIHLQKPP